MAIIKWTPANDMFEDVDRAFGAWLPMRMSQVINPAVDMYEDKDHVTVEMPMAGIDPSKVNIEIEDNLLKVSGQSEHKSEVDEQNYYRKEVRYGQFQRSLMLPKSVKGEQAEATYKDGILKISVPKAEEAKPRRISVKTE